MNRIVYLLLSAAIAAPASHISVDLSQELDRPAELVRSSGDCVPSISGGYAGSREGLPMLPSIPVTVKLPACMTALSVTASPVWETLATGVYVPPLSAPAPLSISDLPAEAEEASDVYGAAGFWPAEPVVLSGTGFLDGEPVAQLLVHPFRWDPATGQLQRMTGLGVSIETAPATSFPLREVDSGSARMLIVTDQSLLAPFLELAGRRTDQGIMTEVITMDSIYGVSSGRDDAEILRNFIKDYHSTQGLDYLLLGGDTGMVPFRKAYAMTCEAGMHPREDSLPCDLYFADLDGDWDANGNDVFGEINDNVDLYPDIFVGRAPVDNLMEAQRFVANIAAYEDCLHDDHYRRVLFLAMILWSNPYTNSGESKDMIDEEFLPDFLDITKLYEALGNENLASTMAALNLGQNFINHDGHAWYSSIGVGDDYMVIGDVDAIDAGGRFAASMYSIGCWSAAFDFDAIGEHFLFNQDGGALGYIGNSSYGWGSPGNPCYGYSDALDHRFHDLLYSDWSLTTGGLLAMTKEYFIPYSQWENVYRWHQYDVNLLGDPSIRPYRNYPQEITVDCPDMVSPGTQFFPVQVSGAPAEGLTVCLRDQGSNWLVTELDATGYHSFQLGGPPAGSLLLTVTGPGVRRTSITVPVSSGPQPVVAGILIDDTGGDGMLSPGDQADLQITLLNQGTQGMTDVTLEAELESGPGSILQSSVTYGDLSPGASSSGSGPCQVQIEGTAANGDIMDMVLAVSSTQGTWELELSLMVCAPGLYFATYGIDDSTGGNDNGIPEPGETVDLTASIANLGLLNASDVTVVMAECSSGITWLSDSASVDSIPPDCTGSFTFTCQLDAGMTSPSFPWLYMDISSPTAGYSSTDSLRLTVGETGISNDVESGALGWTHDGAGDLWNISTVQSHSPTHSWRCGDSEGYDPNMNCALYSPELILAPGAELSFWASFDVAIYGTDGMYVIVNEMNEGEKDTLDYIGSGGALGGGYRGIGTGWANWSYDLDEWGTGNYVQLEFRFISDSDSDTGMGFYLDDISVEGAYTGTTGLQSPQPFAPVMGLPAPNPAAGSFSVPLNI
ncbi:MAG: hypothetical protein JXA64_03825, partial [Candidatus Fermentibacteraceae bacterium]|nr:hypothetical protein [Candidatus Fermentibacteraceae bacterium]